MLWRWPSRPRFDLNLVSSSQVTLSAGLLGTGQWRPSGYATLLTASPTY
jgi:hypothetical protein